MFSYLAEIYRVGRKFPSQSSPNKVKKIGPLLAETLPYQYYVIHIMCVWCVYIMVYYL